jgi:cyclic dehypoxanthinyl futalosine synthase
MSSRAPGGGVRTAKLVDELEGRLRDGGRISSAEAVGLWREASDDELKALASIVRARYHAPRSATYTIMRIINFTNVCVAQCDYCAFYVLPGHAGSYQLTREEVFRKVDELIEMGGDLVGFNGGFNPAMLLDEYCELFGAVRERYGDRIEFYALTIAEFLYLADHARVDWRTAARRLRDSGVRWITGGGAEVLTEDFRLRHSRFKYTVGQFFDAQRALIDEGLRTTATMVIGFDETIEERVEHLERTRSFQDETNALFSFLCWTFKPGGTPLGGREIGVSEYLRHMALSRIYLDNVVHLRTSVLTVNEDAFRALDYGADDFDLPLEDEVTQKAGARIERDFAALLRIPEAMGYRVAYRRPERSLGAAASS